MRVGGRFLFFLIFIALSVSHSIHADDSPAWTAWLHYGRHMTLIDSDGHTLRELDLPLPEGIDPEENYEFSRELGISQDWSTLAYLVQPYGGTTRLILLNTTTSQLQSVFSSSLPDAFGLSSPTTSSFNKLNNALAVGYADHDNNLYINILDTRNADVIYNTVTTTKSLGLEPDLEIWNVYILRYANDRVNFALYLFDPDAGNPDTGSLGRFANRFFTWNVVTRDIQPDTIFSNLESDTFPATGEIIASAFNPLYPTDIFEVGDLLENTLQVYDPTLNAVFPFYQADNVFPRGVFFVQNGTRVLANLYHRDDLKSYSYWTLLERDGTIVDEWALPENLQIDEIKNTPDGFMYTASLKPTDEWNWEQPIPAVYEVDTRDDKLDAGRLIWQIPMKTFRDYFGNSLPYLEIASIHFDAPVGPFKPWAQLADPVYAPTPQLSTATITPTMIPTPPPLFHIGQTVRVQTIDGEILNLRAAPTRKSEILIYIEDDTRLELLEGPVEVEGYHWWRVHTPDGLEGWVVENDGELQTILPE